MGDRHVEAVAENSIGWVKAPPTCARQEHFDPCMHVTTDSLVERGIIKISADETGSDSERPRYGDEEGGIVAAGTCVATDGFERGLDAGFVPAFIGEASVDHLV